MSQILELTMICAIANRSLPTASVLLGCVTLHP